MAEIDMEELEHKLGVLLDEHAAEATGASLERAIDVVGGDVNLQYRLRRYRLIGESLRNELPPAIDPGFHAAVMARIAATEAPAAARPAAAAAPAASTSILGWLARRLAARPVAGLAVAAAVAVVTVALWQPGQRDVAGGGDEFAQADPVDRVRPLPAATLPAQLASQGTRWKVDNPALQQKLNAYLVNHAEYASSMRGLIPQARVAGFDGGR